MNIGIIVYSKTGNTLSVAERIQEKLKEAGHRAELERIVPIGDVHPGVREMQFSSNPSVDGYDAIVFCGHVQAFSLVSAMRLYLSQIGSLKDKKVALFAGKQLPGKWTGGNKAVRTMKDICESKGAEVIGSGIVIWSSKEVEQMKTDTVQELSALFQ